MSIDVTHHAVKRIRERLGLPKKAAQREAERINDALKISDCSGRLRRYLDNERHRHGKANDYRVTPAGVFVLAGNVLITFFPIPLAHRKAALRQWMQREERTKP